jgi:hypothetical protein
MNKDYIHPIFAKRPEKGTKLWRYMSFTKLMWMLENQALYFTRIDKFEDHFEGAWPKDDLERLNKISGFNITSFTYSMRSKVAVSCWLKDNHESAAMWRLYCPGNDGVAINTTFEKLCAAIKIADIGHAVDLRDAAEVDYIDHFDDGFIKKLKPDDPLPNTLWPFMCKNKSYEHEKEVRALLIANHGHEIEESGAGIPIDPVNFIDEIVINPFCDNWFIDTIKASLSKYKIDEKVKTSKLAKMNFYMTVKVNPDKKTAAA